MLNLKIENRPKYKSGPFLIGGPWDRYSGVFGPISNRRLHPKAQLGWRAKTESQRLSTQEWHAAPVVLG